MSHPADEIQNPVPYPEIAEQAGRLADEREDVPTLPEVPPLPRDPEGWLVRICIALAALFFVVLGALAFTCQRR